jgi:hypothetical protein
MIEAAFGESVDKKRDSLPTFDLENLLEPANQVVLPEGSTGADVMVAAPQTAAQAVPNPFDEDVSETRRRYQGRPRRHLKL